MRQNRENITLWGEDVPWLAGLREKGRRAAANAGWPTAKTEAWKYSYFDRQIWDSLPLDSESHHCHTDCQCHHEAAKAPFDAYYIKFCNGHLATDHCHLPAGAELKPLAAAVWDGDAQKYLGKSFAPEKFPLADLNTAFMHDGFMLIVPRGVALDKPLFVHYQQHGDEPRQVHIRNLIVLESRAQATITAYYEGAEGAPYAVNVVNEIYLRESAHLEHYVWHNEAKNAINITLNSVQTRADSTYEAFCANSECALARHESNISLQQKGARAVVNGVYRLADSGVSDITTNIYHEAAQTTSAQLVKGVVDGAAKGVFQGKIHIAPGAQQTEGYQQHKALLLSNDGEVDAKPELEIFADDVKCAHGNTCGDLDAEQLFYMQARGIDLATAKQILLEAHIKEAVRKINNANVAHWLEENFR